MQLGRRRRLYLLPLLGPTYTILRGVTNGRLGLVTLSFCLLKHASYMAGFVSTIFGMLTHVSISRRLFTTHRYPDLWLYVGMYIHDLVRA